MWGLPWFGSMEQVIERQLTIHDFAIHDPLIDLLHVLKTQEIITDEIKQLLNKVNHQKNILKKDQTDLLRKENMLEAIAQATDELLSNTNFMVAISKCLTILGQAAGVDRVYLFENGFDTNNNRVTSQRFEWTSDSTEPQIDNPALQRVPLSVFEDFLERLTNREPFNKLVKDLVDGSDLRVTLEQQQIQSILIVPIFHNNIFWGFVGFDDCKSERVWSDAELALLKAFSNSVGTAIERSENARMIYSMALFATENPDPVIRIDLKGNVLLRNASATSIEYFIADGKSMNDTEFFSFLIRQIEQDFPLISYEAAFGNKSFLVKAHLSESLEHINIYANDISEKKVAEDLLRESERRISSLLVNLQTGILLEDESRKIALTNKMFCEMFNIPAMPDELIGMDCSSAAEETKHLFKCPDEFVEGIKQLLKNKKTVLCEQLELNDGRIVERDYIPIFVQEQYKGHLWKYTDITERKHYERNLKKQEQKYRSIIENMNLGLVEVNDKDEIQYANQSFCDISGYSLEDMLYKNAAALFANKESQTIVDNKHALRKQGVSDSYQVRIKNGTGQQRWWLISGAPNYNDNGDFIGSIGIHLDITEQKKLEEELTVAKRKAEESSKAKEAFLANMSHEIRTPLNAIIGMVRELTKTTLSATQNLYLKNAGSASQHLLSIVNNILDTSKIEAGEFQLDNHPFSMMEVIKQSEAIMLPAAKEKMLELKFDISNDLAPAFIGDSSRMRQILLNFLSNAIKFTDSGNVTVRCQSLKKTEDEQVITLAVSDTGIGIDKNYLKNLFKKFTQEDASINRKYGGTGLGMAITQELIHMMNGKLEVLSEKGKGTLFHMVFRFKIAPHDSINQPDDPSDSDLVKGKRILLVEDNELNRLVATNTLVHYGLEVREACDGAIAVELVQNESFDLILMDLQMPNMNGMLATKIMREELKINTPIIALTANAFKREIENCLAAGMNDYVTKPFEETALIKIVAKHTAKTVFAAQPETLQSVKEINPNMTSNKVCDLNGLISLSRGSNEFILKMIDLFSADVPKSCEKLNEALRVNDLDMIKKIAHRMKPSIDTIKIELIRDTIRYLESIEIGVTPIADIEAAVIQVAKVLQCALDQLKSERHQFL